MNDTQERIDQIAEILKTTTYGFLKLGALLAKAELLGDYKVHGYKRMSQFVAGHFNMKPQRYYQIAQVYDLFGKYLLADDSLATIDFTRLRQLCPLVHSDTPEDSVLDYLHKAKTLTSRDYIAFIKTLYGKPDELTCEHPETTTITRCAKCGMKIGETK